MSDQLSAFDTLLAAAVVPPVDDDRVRCVEALKNVYFSHPMVTQVEADLARLLKYGTVGGATGASTFSYLLTGESGCGKTTILRRFLDEHPMRVEGGRDIYPVLYVEVPAEATKKGLAACILASLGVTIRGVATENKLLSLVLHHLREQGVRLLILDEAQNLVDQRSRAFNYKVTEWLKSVLNAGICSLVLVGMPEAELVYRFNEQLERRSFGNRRMRAFSFRDETEWKTFVALAEALLSEMGLEVGFDRDRIEVMMALRLQSGGRLGRLADFLVTAAVITLEEGRDRVDEEVFLAAAEQLARRFDPKWRNPFACSADDLLERLAADEAPTTGVRLNLRRKARVPKQADIGC